MIAGVLFRNPCDVTRVREAVRKKLLTKRINNLLRTELIIVRDVGLVVRKLRHFIYVIEILYLYEDES
jgi:hypothetical protein